VELNRRGSNPWTPPNTILHTRGVEPPPMYESQISLYYSPHTWSWTGMLFFSANSCNLFSTHVELNRMMLFPLTLFGTILHTRGVEPIVSAVGHLDKNYSPHTWSWTVSSSNWELSPILFSTHVELNRELC